MKSTLPVFLASVVAASAFGACARQEAPAPEPSVAATATASSRASAGAPSMSITSSAFGQEGAIPSKYTCDESDTIPPLTFSDVPENAKTLALVMDDPDVPPPGSGNTWDHWVVWNIPPDAAGVREGEAPNWVAGRNSWGRNDWGGPCPPDREHRYYFRLYALDTELDLPSRAGKKSLERAMEGHIIDKAELMARYARKR